MRCDQCRFWTAKENIEDTDAQLVGVRRCTRVLELWQATEWDDDCERVLKPGFEEQKMFVMDGSCYAAHLYTRPEFFCAHFEVI
jgi:hypothetical protein